jgi:hypothetical protein
MNTKIASSKVQIRCIILFFMAALALSGATAIPVQTELNFLVAHLSPGGIARALLALVLNGIQRTNESFPFLLYGYDWLAFAHLVIAVAFFGPLKDPVKNIWIIEFGMLACLMLIPFALIAGGLRGLPVWWRLIDCSFGVLGFIPLYVCRTKIRHLEKLIAAEKLNLVF